jgi:hypothetical protein
MSNQRFLRFEEWRELREYGVLPEEYTGNYELQDWEITHYRKGWSYPGHCYIEDTTTWRKPSQEGLYYVLIGNTELVTNDLRDAEFHLYMNHYVPNTRDYCND